MEGLRKKCHALVDSLFAQLDEQLNALADEVHEAFKERVIVPEDEEEEVSCYAASQSDSSSSAAPSGEGEEEEEDDEPIVLYDDDDENPKKRVLDLIHDALPPARARKAPKRYDPSNAPDDNYNVEDLDEDGDDDNEDELEHQVVGYRVWLSNIRNGRDVIPFNWSDLTSSRRRNAWFANRYMTNKLETVRKSLGNEGEAIAPTIQGRWDWILAEYLAGRFPKTGRVLGARSEQCALCGGTKHCSYEVNGWHMGLFCAVLAKRWVKFCKVLAGILRDTRDDADHIEDLRALDKAWNQVWDAHVRKTNNGRIK